MKKVLVFSILVVLLACNKDKFQTKPSIAIVNYNTKVIGRDQELQIDLEFTDKEGDLSGGKFVYVPKPVTKRPPQQPYPDSVVYVIPDFPDHSKGQFSIRMKWEELHKSDIQNDTLFFKFVATDRAGNKSDTVNSDQIVVLR